VKKDIHPLYADAVVRCTCGNVIVTRSTGPDITVERCSRCHPAYTGDRTPVSPEGRAARFRRRYGR
jgi:large subunit ribosomal protein L31